MRLVALTSFLARHAGRCSLACFATACLGSTVDAPQTRPEVESVAIELAKRIERSGVRGNKGSLGPRVLVMPFPFSSEINAMLDRGSRRYELADRQCAAEIIQELKMPAQEYLHYAVASWIGRKCAAHLVVMGAAQIKNGKWKLDLLVVQAKNGKEVAKISEKMPWTEEDAKAMQLKTNPPAAHPHQSKRVAFIGRGGTGSAFPNAEAVRIPSSPMRPPMQEITALPYVSEYWSLLKVT